MNQNKPIIQKHIDDCIAEFKDDENFLIECWNNKILIVFKNKLEADDQDGFKVAVIGLGYNRAQGPGTSYKSGIKLFDILYENGEIKGHTRMEMVKSFVIRCIELEAERHYKYIDRRRKWEE